MHCVKQVNNILFLVFKKLILQVRRFTFDLLSDRILVWFIVIFWINNNGVLSSEHAAIMPTYFVSLIQFGLPIFFGLLVIKGTRRKLERMGPPSAFISYAGRSDYRPGKRFGKNIIPLSADVSSCHQSNE